MDTVSGAAHEKEEIKVTPEMAEAGAAELARFTTYFDTLEDGAGRIFRAMLLAARPALKEPFVTK
jgi:hypothetical protein